MEKASRSIIYKEKESITFFLGTGETLERDFINKIMKRPFIQELDDAPGNILRLFNTACYICTLVLQEDYPLLHLKEYEIIAIDNHDEPIWVNHIFPVTMALVVNWLSSYESQKIFKKRREQKDIEEFCKKICVRVEEHSSLHVEGKEEFKELISHERLLPSGFIKDGSFQRRPLIDVVEDRSVKGNEIIDSMGFLANVMKNNPKEWFATIGRGSWFMKEASKATFNPDKKLRELWEWLNQKYKDDNEQAYVKEEAFNGQTTLPCFTSSQMGILMAAVGRITEKDNPPGKTTLGDIVQRIAGYKSTTASQNMRGVVSEVDKKIVADVLKNKFPNLAAEVMKL